MKHYELGDRFSNYIESYFDNDFEDFDLDTYTISELIYKHLFKIKVSLWKQRILSNRKKKTSISDIFQDIIGLYLKLALGKDFEIVLEMKVENFQPDILIKYKGCNLFIIEVKTTIGWDRNSLNGSIQSRIEKLSETFQIPATNIVYIFESPFGVNNKFVAKYWNIQKGKPNPLPMEFPYNKIRPLITSTDPFYWNWKEEKEFDKLKSFKVFSDTEIENYAKGSIIVPIELTIKDIIKASTER